MYNGQRNINAKHGLYCKIRANSFEEPFWIKTAHSDRWFVWTSISNKAAHLRAKLYHLLPKAYVHYGHPIKTKTWQCRSLRCRSARSSFHLRHASLSRQNNQHPNNAQWNTFSWKEHSKNVAGDDDVLLITRSATSCWKWTQLKALMLTVEETDAQQQNKQNPYILGWLDKRNFGVSKWHNDGHKNKVKW